VIGMSLLFSLTRGAWLGFIAAAIYLLWPFGRRWVMAVPVALVLFFLISPPFVRERIQSYANFHSDTSNQARVLMLRTGWRMIVAHPLVGVGPDQVQYSFGGYLPPDPGKGWQKWGWYGHLHNNYVQIAAERGLPALALFVCFLLVIFRDQRRFAARLPAERRYIAHGVAACVVAIAVAGTTEYNFGDSEVAMLFLFFIAHSYAAARNGTRMHAQIHHEDTKGHKVH
jgi:putative inorganic carbon (hco3(-)) transporter